MSKRYPAEFRRSVLEDYRQSSMSQVDFAKQYGLNVYTFREWLYRGTQPAEATTESKTPQFVEVTASEEPTFTEPIRLVLRDDVWLELGELPEPTYIAGLYRALRRC